MCQVSCCELSVVDPFGDLGVDFVEGALERSADGAEAGKCGGQSGTQDAVVGAGEEQRGADLINADGQPMVALSRLLSRNPLPERVATTDLFPEVARFAKELGLSFYMLGGGEEVNRKGVEATLRRLIPLTQVRLYVAV